MKNVVVKKGALLVAAMCIAMSAFAQGMYWQSKTEGTVGERSTENFAVAKKFKMVRTGDQTEGAVVIGRLDKQVFWMLTPEKKTYSEMTFDDMEKMMTKAGGKMDAAMEKMQKELANMPPEQRKMVEQMMKGKMPGSADAATPEQVKKTSETKTICGYNCTKYVVARGDDELMTMWTTRSVQGFEPLMADWKEFAQRMSAMTSRFAKGMADAYKNVDGFPMETTMKMMGQTVTTTVTKIERRSIAASEFEIPAGYTKVKSPMEDAMKKMDEEQ